MAGAKDFIRIVINFVDKTGHSKESSDLSTRDSRVSLLNERQVDGENTDMRQDPPSALGSTAHSHPHLPHHHLITAVRKAHFSHVPWQHAWLKGWVPKAVVESVGWHDTLACIPKHYCICMPLHREGGLLAILFCRIHAG